MTRIRQARHYQKPNDAARLIANKAQPALKADFHAALAHLRAALPLTKIKHAISVHAYRHAVALAIDRKMFEHSLKRPFDRLAAVLETAGAMGAQQITDAHVRAGRRVRMRKDTRSSSAASSSGDIGSRFNFDRFTPETQALIRQYQDELIVQMADETRAVVEDAILGGVREAKSLDEIAASIRDSIGLTDTQAQAVANFRQDLEALDPAALDRALRNVEYDSAVQDAIDSGEFMSSDAIEAMVNDYYENYLDYRANTIATTEANRASNLGLHEAYSQAVESGALPDEAITRNWQLGPNENHCAVCLSIVDLNPEGVGVNESFDSDDGPIDDGPVHPSCDCSVEYVTNLDIVAADAGDGTEKGYPMAETRDDFQRLLEDNPEFEASLTAIGDTIGKAVAAIVAKSFAEQMGVAKDAGVSDVHSPSAVGGGKKRKPLTFTAAIAEATTKPAADPDSLFDDAVTKLGATSFIPSIGDLGDAIKAENPRALKPRADGMAHTPFPHDPQAFDRLRADQIPRFMGAVTAPDALEDRQMSMKDLVAMQDRVDPGKVNAMQDVATSKPPVIVRNAGRNYIADGHHRAAAAYMNGDRTLPVKYLDITPMDQAVKADADESATEQGDGEFEFVFKVASIEPTRQMIFGFASVVEKNGQLIIDKQGDVITTDDLEEAAYDYVLEARQHGDMHKLIGTGRLVESMVFTIEKQDVLGIVLKDHDGHRIVAWWTGFKVDNQDLWEAHKRGERPEFSIAGTGRRLPMET